MIDSRRPLVIDHGEHEAVKSVSPEFPAEGYDELLGSDPGTDVPWHWHEELEAVVVTEGSVRLLVPGRSQVLGEGSGAFVNRDVLHAYRGEPTCRMRSVTFAAELVGGGQAMAITRKYLSPLVGNEACPVVLLPGETTAGASACAHVEEAVKAFESAGRGFEIDVRCALSHLVLDVLELSDKLSDVSAPRAAATQGKGDVPLRRGAPWRGGRRPRHRAGGWHRRARGPQVLQGGARRDALILPRVAAPRARRAHAGRKPRGAGGTGGAQRRHAVGLELLAALPRALRLHPA